MSGNNGREEEESSIDVVFRFGMIFAVIFAIVALGYGIYHLMIIAGWV